MKYRSRHEIVYSILKDLEESNHTKTYVMYGSKLSFTQLASYLEFCLSNNLIKEIDNPRHARSNSKKQLMITSKGILFIEKYEDLDKLLVINEDLK